MGNPLVPLVLAGAAAVLLSSGKKKKSSRKPKGPSYETPPSDEIPSIYRSGEIKEDASEAKSTWIERQEVLQWLAAVTFNTQDGGSFPLCSKCHPGTADGKPGKNTRAAIKAFQAISGMNVDGEWGPEEDAAMQGIMFAVKNDLMPRCDPLLGYPAPFACFVHEGGGFRLKFPEDTKGTPETLPDSEPAPEPWSPEPAPPQDESEYGPDDLLVADAECNYILHQDDRWFDVQRIRCIEYALDGMTDAQAATEINESMLSDYIPLCMSLGRDGVGAGVRTFWDVNAGWINSLLQKYETLPDLLEDEAIEHGIL